MGIFYQWNEIRPSVYHIGSDEQVYMDLFVGTEWALLFDTGYGFGNLHEAISKITQLPVTVVNSHGHPDHVGGNYQFDGPIYIHADDIELCKQFTSAARRRESVEMARHTADHASGQIMDILPKDFDEEAYCCGGTGKLLPVWEGKVFSLGGITLRVVEVPGHTAGSIGLLYEEENIFFAGDAMSPFVWLFAPESKNLSDYIATLKKVKAFGSDYLVVAHHPVMLKGKVLDDYLDAAEQLDYETGIPFSNPMFPGIEARICPRAGYGPVDFGKPGFASVVISRDHIG